MYGFRPVLAPPFEFAIHPRSVPPHNEPGGATRIWTERKQGTVRLQLARQVVEHRLGMPIPVPRGLPREPQHTRELPLRWVRHAHRAQVHRRSLARRARQSELLAHPTRARLGTVVARQRLCYTCMVPCRIALA